MTTPDAEILEGEWPGNWAVVIRFPSRERSLEWYEAGDYAPLKRARAQELTHGANLVLLRGCEPDSGS